MRNTHAVRRLHFIIGFLILALAGLATGGCNRGSAQAEAAAPPEPRKVRVSVAEIRPFPVRDVLVLPGATMPHQDVMLASDQAGRVDWVGPREGDSVKAGDLLVKIDVSTLKAQLDNARASYQLSDSQYERRVKLFERRIISREELDRAKTERSVQAGSVRQAQAAYEQGFIHAPVDGVVNQVLVDAGEFVGRGQPVIELVDASQVEIELSVPELDVKYLRPGGPAPIVVDALPDLEFQGKIDFISYKADPLTKTFRVKVILENPEGKIRPGMIARASLLKRVVPDALAVPLFTLVDKGGERLLFVEEDGLARSRNVTLGILDGNMIQIVEGLANGDRLIVSGQNDVEDGVRVEVE